MKETFCLFKKMTLQEAMVDRFIYSTHQQLREYLLIYFMANNYAKRLKALQGKTPWQFIQQGFIYDENYHR